MILVSPPDSPELSPKTEVQNEAPTFAPHSPVLSAKTEEQNDAPAFAPHSPVLSPMNGVHIQPPAFEASVLENQIQHRVETVSMENEVCDSSNDIVF